MLSYLPVILESDIKNKSHTVSTLFLYIVAIVIGVDVMILMYLNVDFKPGAIIITCLDRNIVILILYKGGIYFSTHY